MSFENVETKLFSEQSAIHISYISNPDVTADLSVLNKKLNNSAGNAQKFEKKDSNESWGNAQYGDKNSRRKHLTGYAKTCIEKCTRACVFKQKFVQDNILNFQNYTNMSGMIFKDETKWKSRCYLKINCLWKSFIVELLQVIERTTENK